MNIYTKLREAVERSMAISDLVMGDVLVAELKELEEEENKPKSSCCGATTFEDSVLTIQGPMILLKCQKCQKPCDHDRHVCGVLSESARACKDCSKFMPPLTKEEKDYYEGLRPKEEWWNEYLLTFRNGDGSRVYAVDESSVPGLVAEARKGALEEVREMIKAKRIVMKADDIEQAVLTKLGNNVLVDELVEKLDEMK